MSDLLKTALRLTHYGYCVLPVRTDGTKAPAVRWQEYQHRKPNEDELRAWFTDGRYHGLGIVTGAVSGGTELAELEGRAAQRLADLVTAMTDNGLADLWAKVFTGWLEQSPSGGYHWHYRVLNEHGQPAAKPNTKLARRRIEGEVEVLAETRGEGGFTILAPSAGATHPTGKPWRLIHGGPDTCPVLTVDERDALHAVITMTLDEMPVDDGLPHIQTRERRPDDGLTPGDDYNTRATWDDLLTPRGWTKVTRMGRGYAWRRPGKTIGISATTAQSDDGADRLYVFSTSTDFDAQKPYSKFAALALLEHRGDFSACAKALRAAGYGTPRPEPTRPADPFAGIVAGGTDGNLATVHQLPHLPQRPPLSVAEPTTYSATDDGNALRLVDTYGHILRYCPQRGSWLSWDGHRWAWDEAGTARELARAVARDLPTDGKDQDAHRRRSLSGQALGHMVRLAQSDRRIVVHLRDLDHRPYELNTPGGVIDLRSGTLRAPDPAALHTRSTGVAPNLDTEPQQWLRFLAETFAGDPTLTTYVQRLLGVSLIGVVLEQMLPFAYGAGANGKTTLLGATQRIIGLGEQGYSISAPADLLLATTHNDHPASIAQLSGARLVVTSEIEDGQRFAEARIKQLTGRDPINARFMRQDPFTFLPTHTIWMLANHQPVVRAGGPAFWRRIKLLPFLHTVPPERRDGGLEDRLVEQEGPAILGWLIRGAADYLAHGLAEPDSVRVATDAYAHDQDTVARFVEDTCQTGEPTAQHMAVRVTELRQAYETWCRTEGETPVSARALTQALVSRFGVTRDRTADSRYYRGIRLVDVSPARADDDGGWAR